MGTYNFKFQCSCIRAATLINIIGANAQAWKDDAKEGGHYLECPSCGSNYRTIDDGLPVSVGGGIQVRNESRPRLDSLSINSGSMNGGTIVRITGHAFSHDIPTVIFGGTPSKFVTVINDTTLETVTPVGSVNANIASGPYINIAHDRVIEGPFQIGETVSGNTSGASAVVTTVGPSHLLVTNIPFTSFQAGEVITGNTSGATATFSEISLPVFRLEEQVIGLTSNQSGFISQTAPGGYYHPNRSIRIKALTGLLTPGEEIYGSLSGARAKLDDSVAIIGAVDVEIANSWGTRTSGSKIVSGFSYSV